MLKRISVPLFCAAWLVFSVLGCSVWNQTIEGRSSVDTSESRTQVLEKDVAKFVSGVKPYQEDPDSIYRRACYFQERKKHKIAIEEFGKVLAIDPRSAKAYNGMGVCYDSLGEHSRAIQCYEAALALDSGLHYVYNNLGYSYLLQGKLDPSIKAFEKAIALNKDEKRYHNNLALACAQEGLFERAHAEFKLGGDEASAKQNLARLHLESLPLKNHPNQPTLASISRPAEGGGDTSGETRDNGPYYRGKITVNPLLPVAEAPTIGTGIPKTNEEPVGLNSYALSAEKMDPDQINEYQDSSASLLKTRPDGIITGANALAIPHEPAVASKEKDDDVGTKEGMAAIGGKEEEHQTPLLFCMFSGISQGSEIGAEEQAEAAVDFPQKALASRKASEKESSTALQPAQAEALKLTGATQIELSNGNGVRHMARDMGEYLKSKGLKITRLTNASHFSHGKTTIYYCDGYQREAQDVAKEIPTDSDMKEINHLQRPNIKVKVLIGKDMAPFRVVFVEGRS
jgi:lipoprotein NlpI